VRLLLATVLAGVLLAFGGSNEARAAQLVLLPLAGATAISADGSTVIGNRGTYPNLEAARWTRAEGTIGLGLLPGFTACYASGVSANGSVVVGTCDGPSGNEAFRWTADDGITALGFLPGMNTDSFASAVSADGSVIVGASRGASGQEAFRWTSVTGMVGIGDLPGGDFDSAAEAVSADGSIVAGGGSSGASLDASEAMRWTSVDGMESLGDLPGGDFYSVLWGSGSISADGSTIVGYSDSASGREAFRWTTTQGMMALGLPPGAIDSYAMATSGDGSIVVGRVDYSVFSASAFIWDAAHGVRGLDEVMTDLGVDMTNLTLLEPWGISADGRFLVGNGFYDASQADFTWMADLAPDCSDGIDNDGDGLIDYPADPGCTSPTDNSEHESTLPCDDGIDNDGDGLIDYKADGSGDPGCAYPAFPTESPACQDGIDNDGDGKIDFDGGVSATNGAVHGTPDPGCTFAFRQSEVDPPHCGLGAEMAFVMLGAELIRRRKRVPKPMS